MNNRARVDWEDEDDAPERVPEASSAGSRRAVLGGAAGGLALASSCLLLPPWLVEDIEAADNHPARRVQDRQDGQRTRRRHRLSHRREVNRRQRDKDTNDDQPRGGSAPDTDTTALVLTMRNLIELPSSPSASVALWENRAGWRQTEDEFTLSYSRDPVTRRFPATNRGDAFIGILLKILGATYSVTTEYNVPTSAVIRLNPNPSAAGYPANGERVAGKDFYGLDSLRWPDPTSRVELMVVSRPAGLGDDLPVDLFLL